MTVTSDQKKNIDDLDARSASREANIELVRKLELRGVRKPLEIQAYFNRQSPPIDVTIRTIARYKAIVKKRNAKRLVESDELNKTLEELLYELRDDYFEVRREAWVIYHSATSTPAAKVQALALIGKTAEAWLDRLQSVGLVHKEPDKTQIIGADGKPIDPTTQINVNVENLAVQFTSFIKAKYQEPLGVIPRQELQHGTTGT